MKVGRLVINIEILGRKAPPMIENPRLQPGQKGWTLHQCPDKTPCKTDRGGCASGWCAHFRIEPDHFDGTPRFVKE